MVASASRPSSPSSNASLTRTRSPSMWRDTETVNMMQPQNTLISPTGAATVVSVTHVHGEGSSWNTSTPTQHSDNHTEAKGDHEIYYYQLLTRKRGSPLWIPGPGSQLPIEYRRQGISIGDVGIIVAQSGEFDFLFNILQPADHPINASKGVPESFSPLDRTRLEIVTRRIYGRNTYLTSSSVRTTGINSSSDLRFESTEREAAILTMPEGALTQNLLNGQVIRDCIAENATSWFKYARARGRIVENGDIRVVVGWDKVCSWGIATSTSTSGQSVSLAFRVDGEVGTSRVYCWECIGSGSGRVGPEEDEIADLRQEDGGAPQNQCVFVRTMNFSLAGDIGDDYSATAVHLPMSDKAKGPKGQHNSGSSQSSSMRGGSRGHESVKFAATERGIVHPTALLHKLLLKKYPNATMVITQDADWISVLTDEDTCFPEPEDLYARLSESYEVHESDGIVTLQEKPYKRTEINPFIRKPTQTDAERHGNRDLNRIAVTPTRHDNRVSNTEVVTADYQIYYYQLLKKKRGFPLWIPGPGLQLPIEYRRQGISIGDVGIITESGGFDFLFNIFLFADHPINGRGVPESFSPLDHTRLEIETVRIYGRNTYLTSSSVRTTGINSSSDLMFESTEREAAILTMPEGALTQNLLNYQVVRKYVAENATSWYEYARDTRERTVKSGDIRVVVGCDKVRSWGIATSTSANGQPVSLAFKVDEEVGTSRVYRWKCIGSGSGRVGPEENEIADLRQDSKDGGAPENQCVFVRTMNFSFAGDIGDDYSATAVHLPMSDKAKGPKGQHNSGSRFSHGQSSSMRGGSRGHESVKFAATERGIVHPTASLHKFLLEKYPNATMVITQDADWISVLTDEDTCLPEPEDLCGRLSESYEVRESDGIVTLQEKPYERTKIIPFIRKPTQTDAERHGNRDLNRIAVTPTQHDNRVSNTEVVTADYQIYCYQLLKKKRGFPLWIPGPGLQLPIEYRRQGISIGDVGIITESGGFDFLFNIFLFADHPINGRGVPESFSPLYDDTQLDIETVRIYGCNTYFTSSFVRTTGINSSSALMFESTEQEAAILIMPEGALTQNLLNYQVVRRYVAEFATSWYEYARDTRGRTVESGDIRVVVGCDKVRSWGIATSTSANGQPVSLAFKVDDEVGTYRWKCIGSGSGRVGPHEEEIAGLRQEDGGAPENQCVFVRTMTLNLGGDIGNDWVQWHK